MTTVILAALGVLSFWVAHSIEALGESLRRELGAEIAGSRGELGSDITGVRRELGAEIAGLRGELGSDITGVRRELGAEIAGLRGELRSEIAGLRGELGSDITGVRGGLGSEIAGLRSDIRRVEERLASIETKVLDDHGQRIARLEERAGS